MPELMTEKDLLRLITTGEKPKPMSERPMTDQHIRVLALLCHTRWRPKSPFRKTLDSNT